MELHPDVQHCALPGGGEELLLAPLDARTIAATLPTWIALLLMAAGFGLSCGGMAVVSGWEPSPLRALLSVAFIIGGSGAAPLGLLLAVRGLATARQPNRRLALDPLGLQIGALRLRWGELSSIWVAGDELCFLTDSGQEHRVRLYHQPADRMDWLARHLSMRLEQSAPGAPEDVPTALRGLKQELGPPR